MDGLERLVRLYRRKGVHLSASRFNTRRDGTGLDLLLIGNIEVPPSRRGNGLGTAVMQGLLRYADKHRLIACLTVDDGKSGTPRHKLMRWYKRLGFTETAGSQFDRPGGVPEGMYRLPERYVEEEKHKRVAVGRPSENRM